jgi:hypothetical protein
MMLLQIACPCAPEPGNDGNGLNIYTFPHDPPE